MRADIKRQVLLNLPLLVPCYFGNKLSHFYGFFSGGDTFSHWLALLGRMDLFSLFPWHSFAPKDILIGLLTAGLLKVFIVIKSRNKKKYRKDIEYGSARWGAYYQL